MFYILYLYLYIYIYVPIYPYNNIMYINFMVPLYGWSSTASKLQPLRGGSLLFAIQVPEIPGTHFIDLGRMKG